jgi:hypothetical protein
LGRRRHRLQAEDVQTERALTHKQAHTHHRQSILIHRRFGQPNEYLSRSLFCRNAIKTGGAASQPSNQAAIQPGSYLLNNGASSSVLANSRCCHVNGRPCHVLCSSHHSTTRISHNSRWITIQRVETAAATNTGSSSSTTNKNDTVHYNNNYY